MTRFLHLCGIVVFFFAISCDPAGQGIPGDLPQAPSLEEPPQAECPDGFQDSDGDCLPTCTDGQCEEGYWCHLETSYCLPNWLNNGGSPTTENDTTASPNDDSPETTPDEASSDNDEDGSENEIPEINTPESNNEAPPETNPTPESDDEGGCESFIDCPFGENCEEGNCVSVDLEIVDSCEEDSDCGFFMTCQFGVCIGCIDDLQCPNGQCIYGLCVSDDLGPGLNCLEANCPQGEHCDWTTGICEPTCGSDNDCAEDEFCSLLTQSCEPEFRCEDSSECNTGMCIAGVCVGCQDDADCATGTQCTLGACLPNPLGYNPCDDAQCDPNSQSCDPTDGACYPSDGSCQNDADCREDHNCSSFFNVCTGCGQDSDCRPEQRCLLSACVSL